MKNCSNCEYWDNTSLDSDYDLDYGLCVISGSINGCPDKEDTLAYAEDYDSYSANLKTNSKFYCNQWKSKK